MTRLPKQNVSRRQLLKMSGGLAAGALLAACAPAPAAPAAPAATTAPAAAEATKEPEPTAAPDAGAQAAEVVMMYQANEISDPEIAQFNKDYAPIKLSRVDVDRTAFYASVAAGTPPDLYRTQAPDIPQFLARKIPLNLSDYFKTSKVLALDDLMVANDYYKAGSPTSIGQGDIYGMAKDWAPDGFIWVNEAAFTEAGATPPDGSKVMSSTDLVELAKSATKKDGDKFVVTGLDVVTGFIDRFWMSFAAAAGGSMFSEDFKSAKIVGNTPVVDAIKFFYDLMVAGLVRSPINPSAAWFGPDFAANQTAMVHTGFWFSGFLNGEATSGKNDTAKAGVEKNLFKMYPMFTWNDKRQNICITATGAVIVDPKLKGSTAGADAQWTVFEWFMGKEPAQNRAKSGWGLPALKSMFNLVPNTTDFDKQKIAVIEDELKHQDYTLKFNPYLAGGEPMVPGQTFVTNLEAALKGGMSFDDMLKKIEDETNKAIQEGVTAVGG